MFRCSLCDCKLPEDKPLVYEGRYICKSCDRLEFSELFEKCVKYKAALLTSLKRNQEASHKFQVQIAEMKKENFEKFMSAALTALPDNYVLDYNPDVVAHKARLVAEAMLREVWERDMEKLAGESLAGKIK